MPRKPKVWLCTPLRHFEFNGLMTQEAFEQLPKHYREVVVALQQWKEMPWDLWVNITGGGGIFQARNLFVSDFIREGGEPDDKLWFWDSDLMPTAQDAVNLLSHDLSIVGGLYTTRADNGHWVMNLLPQARASAKGVLPVMELGTGFKTIKRKVLTKVLEDNPWLECESDVDHSKKVWSFFSMGPVWDKKLWPGKGRALTEDYWLDWLCRESGFVTCVDTNIKLRHKDDFTERVYPAVFPPTPGALPAEAKEP